MAMNSIATSERTLTGRVVCVNDNGLKFEGAGAWTNVSKYAVGVVLPQKGETVTVTLDKSGFIRSVAPVNGVAPSGHQRPVQADTTRERTITRLAVLKAAAEFSASKQASSSADVLKIAESWERWVTREDEPTGLTDAF
jgi:hypothetical protein